MCEGKTLGGGAGRSRCSFPEGRAARAAAVWLHGGVRRGSDLLPVPSAPGKGKPRRRRRRRKSISGEQRPGSSHQHPGGPHRQAEGPIKDEYETSRTWCFIKCINTHFQNDLRFHRRLLSPALPSPPRHLRTSTPRTRVIFTGTGKEKSSRYLQRFGNKSSSPSRGLRAHLVIPQGLKNKQTKKNKRKRTHTKKINKRRTLFTLSNRPLKPAQLSVGSGTTGWRGAPWRVSVRPSSRSRRRAGEPCP